jgi:hypothetical protein
VQTWGVARVLEDKGMKDEEGMKTRGEEGIPKLH